jgi:hypothetical protein
MSVSPIKQNVMESLIGILVAVAVLVFKFIAKSMEESGRSPAKPVQPGPIQQGLPSRESMPSPYQEFEPLPEPGVEFYGNLEDDGAFDASEILYDEAMPSIDDHRESKISVPDSLSSDTPSVHEQKEKIDPKKLIIYSEIMNRKY